MQRASLCPHPLMQVSLVVENVSASTDGNIVWKPSNVLT